MILVDRAAGAITLKSLGSREAFALGDLRSVEVERNGNLRRLVLVYGDHRRPLTDGFFYGIAHHDAVARSMNEFLLRASASQVAR